MTPYVILVTGARQWPLGTSGRRAVYESLRAAATRLDPEGVHRAAPGHWQGNGPGYWPNITVRQGGATGLDTVAERITPMLGMVPERVEADWEGPCDLDGPLCQPRHRMPSRYGTGDYCPTAGHRRNRYMCECGAHECLGYPVAEFPYGGTWDCMMHAAELEIPVRQVALDGSTKLWERAELLRGREILAANRRKAPR